MPQKVGIFQGANDIVYFNQADSATPGSGDIWFDHSNTAVKVYNGSSWQKIGSVIGSPNQVIVIGSDNSLTASTNPKDTVFTITDGASVDIDPDNGGIQVWTLGADRSPTASNFDAGAKVMLMIADGSSYSITWPSVNWVGGVAPTLPTSGYGIVELWKVGSQLYGAYAGGVA